MFPAGGFPPAYFGRRYFPKHGATVVVGLPAERVELRLAVRRRVDLVSAIARTSTLTRAVTRTVDLEVRR